MNNNLKEKMVFRKDRVHHEPLFVTKINDKYIVAAYQGNISELDILIKYRQKENEKWTRIRTPKHIHWTVDILIKMHSEKQKTKEFLDFLINVWNSTNSFINDDDRKQKLTFEYLIESSRNELDLYDKLSTKGEYSIKFLILLAKLLMLQEKTNLESAYMFKNLLEALKTGSDIFKIVSIATHSKR